MYILGAIAWTKLYIFLEYTKTIRQNTHCGPLLITLTMTIYFFFSSCQKYHFFLLLIFHLLPGQQARLWLVLVLLEWGGGGGGSGGGSLVPSRPQLRFSTAGLMRRRGLYKLYPPGEHSLSTMPLFTEFLPRRRTNPP